MIGRTNNGGGGASVVSIAVTHAPTKTSYKDGETLNLTGMIVTATMSDGSTEAVTGYTTIPANGSVLHEGTSSVTISYNGCIATQAITVSPAVVVKSFASATDAELKAMIQALDAGTITTSDLGWKAGDSRSVSLSSFTSYPSGSASTQAAQTATMVILNVGGKTFRGNGTSLDGQTVHYVVGFKDNVAKSYYHASSNVYANSLLKTVENNVYNALPSDVKACFKKFDVVTGTSDTQNATTQQYFTSAAAKEIFGGSTASSSGSATSCSYKAEFNALSQFTYYATANNRKHSNLSTFWWERSPSYYDSGRACYVNSGGPAGSYGVYYDYGVSPFGCM